MIWLYTMLSVLAVSLISLIGVFTLSIDQKKLYKFLIYPVSLSVGTLMGDAFIHLIPEAFEKNPDKLNVSIFILLGIILFFILEKIIHWRHCHKEPNENHPHPFSFVILFGDAVHNFIDGLIIGASFLVSVPVGIATTTAVIFHEIPHEIGNFASLIYGGLSRSKALLYNFLSAILAIFGAILVLLVRENNFDPTSFLIPFAAGGFIYVASADLIPEMHKHTNIKKSLGQLLFFIGGVVIMASLLWLEK